jgi:alcohol dehydrogenase (cytochrome c)
MKRKALWVIGVLAFIVVAAGLIIYSNLDAFITNAAMAVNWVRYRSAPAGTLETEVAARPPQLAALAAPETGKDWPSYNRTLTSDRFAGLDEINTSTAARLKVLCTYDTGTRTGFTTGLVEVRGRLLFATEFDTYAIDPDDCHLICRLLRRP